MTAPAWEWCRVHRTPFYRLWRYWSQAPAARAANGRGGIEQVGAVVDDFGTLVVVPEDVL